MKRISSLIFALISTMFLFVGATQAAQKFDPVARAIAKMEPLRADDPPPPPPGASCWDGTP